MGAAQPKPNGADAGAATFNDPALRAKRQRAVAGLVALRGEGDTTDYAKEALYQSADQTEARLQARRRQLASTNTPDAADLAIRDVATGRVRRARGGSSSTALGGFSPSRQLGADSVLGGY